MENTYQDIPIIQLIRLCSYIQEDAGSGLSEADFSDQFLMMLENMAMLPFESIPEQNALVDDGYFVYQILTNRRPRI